jgi:uncharacterized protein (TIGR03085 family)
LAHRYAQAERQSLVDLMAQLGPDAPTLCAGWTTRDLAAHLVVRERRPDAAIGIVAPPLSGYTARVQSSVAARPWAAVLDSLRHGPPYPMRLVDEQVNVMEYFVHHEDVRRAVGQVPIRSLDPDLQEELWGRLKLAGRVFARKAPVGLTLAWPGHGSVVAHRAEPDVTVTGEPGELVLFAFGRQDDAQVELSGDPEAVGQLRRSSLGL